MSQDCWSPFDCVDLGHQSTVDDACLVKDLITAQGQYESSVGHRNTYPVQLG